MSHYLNEAQKRAIKNARPGAEKDCAELLELSDELMSVADCMLAVLQVYRDKREAAKEIVQKISEKNGQLQCGSQDFQMRELFAKIGAFAENLRSSADAVESKDQKCQRSLT